MNKITVKMAKLKTAEEILNGCEIEAFRTKRGLNYNRSMNSAAEALESLVILELPENAEDFLKGKVFYDYVAASETDSWLVKAEWIKGLVDVEIGPDDERYIMALKAYNRCKKIFAGEDPDMEIMKGLAGMIKEIFEGGTHA
jgi:hypothetical protein